MKPNGSEETFFYGLEGEKLGTYTGGTSSAFTTASTNVYFAGKLIWAEGSVAVTDRLGSVVSGGRKYFPYGEEPYTTTHDRTKFATYYRDNTTALDYAVNRFYGRTIGRFLTPDPYIASSGPADPESWNRYSYAQCDPVNFLDPTGLYRCGDLQETYGQSYVTLSELVNQETAFGLFAGVVWAEASAIVADQIAVAQSIVNRWFIVNGYIWIGRPSNRTVNGWEWANGALLGWGKPGGITGVLIPSQYATLEDSGGTIRLIRAGELPGILAGPDTTAACKKLRTAVSAALNAWQGLHSASEIPFLLSNGLVTSFNWSENRFKSRDSVTWIRRLCCGPPRVDKMRGRPDPLLPRFRARMALGQEHSTAGW